MKGKYHADSAYEIRWEPSKENRRYQIAAVTRDGERMLDDVYHTFGGEQSAVVIFPVPLDSVDHLEIRPFGGRHSFFFDGVQLPLAKSSRSFAAPPTAIIQVGGAETTKTVSEFIPLDVRVRLVDGNFGSGSTAGSTSMSLTPRPDGPTERGDALSLIIDERGIGELPFQFRFRQQGSWTSGTNFSGGAQSTGSSRMLIERDYRMPIESVDAVEVSIAVAP